MIHATYRGMSATQSTAEFSNDAPAAVRLALHAFMVENRVQFCSSCGTTSDSEFDGALLRLLVAPPCAFRARSLVGDIHTRCLAAVLGDDIVTATVASRSLTGLLLFSPADLTWSGSDSFCALDSFDDLCAWHNCGPRLRATHAHGLLRPAPAAPICL